MKVTSVGALSMQELRPQEPVKPPAGGVLGSQSSHLETNEEKNNQPRVENLSYLIHEAKKRTEHRRKTSDKRKRDRALMTYINLRDFDEIADSFGLNLDREV